MLRLSSPDLPTTDQKYVVTRNRVLQLYSDLNSRGVTGVIARIRRSQGGDEIDYLSSPIAKGYFYPLSFTEDFIEASLLGYKEVSRPSLLTGDSFWRRNLDIGIYSRELLPSPTLFTVTAAKYYRILSTSLDVAIATNVSPTKVSSLGYNYEPGTGENQWEYAGSTLTIHTSASSQIQPNQLVQVEGAFDVDEPSLSLQIISYQVAKEDLITGVDMFGRSFTPAWNNYSPKDGEFTLSENGILNLYVSMEVLLPEVGAATTRNLVVNTGTLTYSRLTA